MPMKLIRNVTIYAPEFLGKRDILVTGGVVGAIGEDLTGASEFPGVGVLDGEGLVAVPGLIDAHVHILGGGGEGGFETRTPEIEVGELVSAGITTVVGCLGTDGITRYAAGLVAKAKALKQAGLEAFVYTGSYQLPVRTATGTIGGDMTLIEEVLGIGEIALADHRSSQPTAGELAKAASETHVAGLLSGKAGIVNIHIGDGKSGLGLLRQVLETSDLPIGMFYPTHLNRSERVFEEAVRHGLAGGWVDLTTSTTESLLQMGEVSAPEALRRLLERGVPLDRITFTSDGQGSLPVFTEEGRLAAMTVGSVASLLEAVKSAVSREGIPLEQVLKTVTSNPAAVLGLERKGRLSEGADADVVLLDEETLSVEAVIAQGSLLLDRQGRFRDELAP